MALLGLSADAEPPKRTKAPREDRVRLQLLGVNDFHGHLQPPRPGYGGAAYLGAHMDRAAAAAPGRTIRVHAGDMLGASPLVSSRFHDEPTVKAMNLMRFDVGTLGNHEFDEGGDELMRLIRGGVRRDGRGRPLPTSDPVFRGVAFPYIAANTVDRRTGRPLLPPYRVVRRAGVRVGFVGVTTESTPDFLLPRHASRFRWLDISDAVNRQVGALRRRGVESIVVLAHSGAYEATGDASRAVGEIVGETREMSDAVDVVIAGHTHSHLNLRVDGKLVVEALSYGTNYDRIGMTLDRRSGDVVASSATTPATRHGGIDARRDLRALVDDHARRVAPIAKRVVGFAPRPLPRSGPGLGRLVADGQRRLARADVALVNPGNMRAGLDRGPVTYEELFEIQAYEHPLIRMRMRGADLRAALAQQETDESTVTLFTSGVPHRAIRSDRSYSVVANELLAEGERFSVLRDRGRNRRVVGTDLEALVSRFRQVRPR